MNILWGITIKAPSPEYMTSGDYISSAARAHLKGSLCTWRLLVHPTFCPRDHKIDKLILPILVHRIKGILTTINIYNIHDSFARIFCTFAMLSIQQTYFAKVFRNILTENVVVFIWFGYATTLRTHWIVFIALNGAIFRYLMVWSIVAIGIRVLPQPSVRIVNISTLSFFSSTS